MSQVRKSARGEACSMQTPGVCNQDWYTTVLAHIRFAGTAGVGMKPPDFPYGIYSCSACHDMIDGRTNRPEWYTKEMMWQDIARAIARTHHRMQINGTLEKVLKTA